MTAPSWSPDGSRIVFAGLTGGMTDLFTSTVEGDDLQRLTNDRYAHLHPTWSPDGKKIAFTTDRGPNTNIDSLIFGEYNIALFDLETKEVELLTRTGGNHINPVWSQDGSELLFISDMNGIPNIYSMDLATRDIYQVTDLVTGVSGIITESPAITLAPETGRLAFSAFWDAGWYIYTLDNFEKTKVADNLAKNVLEPLEDPNDKYREYAKADSSEFLLSSYNSKMTPDLVVGAGAFATNVGFAGQTAFLFSDMLGDKTLLVQASLYGDPLESTLIASYYNQKRRLNWSFAAFQFRNDYSFYTTTGLGFETQIYRGIGLGAAYPFNPFTRLEVNSNAYFVDRDLLSISAFGDVANTNIQNAFYMSGGVSLIRDTAMWGFSAPISGTRARFSINQNVGDFKWTTAVTDYRKYFALQVPRVSLAYRLYIGSNFGKQSRFFSIGGPFSFRGADYSTYIGTKIAFQNMELRFPVFPFLPMQYDFLTAVAFYDAANAWDETYSYYYGYSKQDFNSADNPIRTAYGLGLRFNLGGLLVLRWDFPIKHEEGEPGVFFSIGIDY